MRIGHVHHEECPICEYEMNHCQCIFSGDGHPNTEIRKKIVKDHLELLSPKQIGHLVALEEWWNTSYGDPEYIEEFNRLKEFLKSDKEGEQE